MEVHKEVPPADLWSHIEMSLNQKRKAKVIYFRRTLYTTVAVAASLVTLLVINKSSHEFNDTIEVVTQKELLTENQSTHKEELSILEELSTPEKLFVSERIPSQERPSIKEEVPTQKKNSIQEASFTQEKKSIKETSSAKEEISTQENNSIKETSSTQEKKAIKDNKSTQDSKKGRSNYNYPSLDTYKSVRRRKGSPILAFATNLSPSTGSHSVSLMAMSQAQGGFAPNNVVSTVQKATVPQEVISNTKFLMPVSVGVQLQMPITKILSVGIGANYTLLFSRYDAISRQETRETQQTLHYIGIPLNLYLNIMQKDNLRLYATGGVAIEKGLYAFYRVSENGARRSHGESIDGMQWSLTGGLGVELAVNNSTGLYFDPTVAYFFDNNQPISSRTSQPLQFKFELGFRFHL